LALPCLPVLFYRLPSFALPFKRFVSSVVRDRAEGFLGSDESYRAAVKLRGCPIVYDDRQPEALGQQAAALAHTTLWRWLSWWGDGLSQAIRRAREWIHQRNPASGLHRESWNVSPYKYRSEARRETLQRALEALVVTRMYQALFGKAMFP
jgi:hypothetical protein